MNNFQHIPQKRIKRKPMISFAEIADLIGISQAKLRGYITKDGPKPSLVHRGGKSNGGNSWYVKDDVTKWIAKMRQDGIL